MLEATTSALVIITTVLFGGVTSLVQNCLLPKPKEEKIEALDNSVSISPQIGKALLDEDLSVATKYEEFQHPNLINKSSDNKTSHVSLSKESEE